MQSNSNNLKFVDLFCGAGGMTLGFINNSFVNTFSLDNDKNSSKTYKGNFKDHNLITINIEDISDDDISKLCKDDIDVIIGGPPCQGFSIAGVIGRKFIDDSRNYLFREFFRFVKIIKPKVFVMENVARLYNHKEGKSRDEIIKLFESIGYKVKAKILNSAEFGVPQVRNRVFFIGCYLENFSGFPKGTFEEFRNIKSAIEDLVPLKSGMKSNIPNHNAMNHSEQMLKKMSFLNDGEDRTKIPLNLRPISGDVRKYIKYDSSKPSITITGDMRKVFHYSQNRALTNRELARIQTFPDDFIFHGSSISVQQQIGNAVPPLMAKSIAKFVRGLINEKKISK